MTNEAKSKLLLQKEIELEKLIEQQQPYIGTEVLDVFQRAQAALDGNLGAIDGEPLASAVYAAVEGHEFARGLLEATKLSLWARTIVVPLIGALVKPGAQRKR